MDREDGPDIEELDEPVTEFERDGVLEGVQLIPEPMEE